MLEHSNRQVTQIDPIDAIRQKYTSSAYQTRSSGYEADDNNLRLSLCTSDIAWKYLNPARVDIKNNQDPAYRVSFQSDSSEALENFRSSPAGVLEAFRIIDGLKRGAANYGKTEILRPPENIASMDSYYRQSGAFALRSSIKELKQKRKAIDQPLRHPPGRSRSQSPEWYPSELDRLMLLEKGRRAGAINPMQVDNIIKERWRMAEQGARKEDFSQEKKELKRRLLERNRCVKLERLKDIYNSDITMIQKGVVQREASREKTLITKAVSRIFMKGIKNEESEDQNYRFHLVTMKEESKSHEEGYSQIFSHQKSTSTQRLSKNQANGSSHLIVPITLGLRNQDNTLFNLSYSKDEDSPLNSKRFIPSDLISVVDAKVSDFLPSHSRKNFIAKANTHRMIPTGLSQFGSRPGNLTQRASS